MFKRMTSRLLQSRTSPTARILAAVALLVVEFSELQVLLEERCSAPRTSTRVEGLFFLNWPVRLQESVEQSASLSIIPGDICRVVHQATMRTGQVVESQWICELFPGTFVKILELDTTAAVGRQRALVQTQLVYIKGWISTRTARSNCLVEKLLADEECLFDLPGSMQVCGCDLGPDPATVAQVVRAFIGHIRHQPDFGTLTSADFMMSQRLQSLFRAASGGDAADLDSQRLRWSLWATLSPNRSSPEGLAIVAVVLLHVRDALLELEAAFWRLHEEFLCLEDADAEALFNSLGETDAAAMTARHLSERCRCSANAITLPSSMWFTHLPNPSSIVSELLKGEQALMDLHSALNKLTSQRRALVARVKAAVEAKAATEAVSAASLLADALRPDRRLDFPLITELCERATSDPSELAEVVNMLSSLVEESQELLQRFKALTITNELMYDDAARQAFARKTSFLAALMQPMRQHISIAGDQSSSGPSITASIATELAAANAQLLTTEIARRVSAEADAMKAGCFAASPTAAVSASSWLTSVAHTPSRQTRETERLLSWPQTRNAVCALRASLQSNAASVSEATAVLDQIYRCLDESTSRVLELRQSLTHTISSDVGELIEDFLRSAEHVNASVLEWKCRAVDILDTTEASAAGCSPLSSRGQRKMLGKLLDRAESVGESLNACLTVLLARRPVDATNLTFSQVGESCGEERKIRHPRAGNGRWEVRRLQVGIWSGSSACARSEMSMGCKLRPISRVSPPGGL